MPSPLLSKSAFKLGLECPRRLAYLREGYPSRAAESPYLEFLADGGFMVEAIARALFPGGTEITPRTGERPADATRRQLDAAADATLFEAVFEHDGCSARVDILSRRGSTVELIEVKAKSFDSATNGLRPWLGAKGGIIGEWQPYLDDLAFQTQVVRGALGSAYTVVPKLCLVDKSRTCNDASIFSRIDLLPRAEATFGLPRAYYRGDATQLRDDHFLGFLDASAEVSGVLARAAPLAQAVRDGSLRSLPILLGKHCRDCEYHGAVKAGEPKDGFRECWGELAEGSPHLLDLYQLGRLGEAAITQLVNEGVVCIRDLPQSSIQGDGAIARTQRVQVQCVRSGNEWRGDGLAPALVAAQAPLHFVDFETSRIAVPYHPGMHPYEQVAFQFSCHTAVDAAAERLEHREWINIDDRWPNVRFAQALREAIGDTGQMLVWSHHEQTALKEIRDQIRKYGKGPADLADWLDQLIAPAASGGRVLDLLQVCRQHYYHPAMGSSFSLKAVLAAVWEADTALHTHPWFKQYLHREEGRVLSPYEALPAIEYGDGESCVVREGTQAMRAYQDMVYGLRRSDAKYRDACRDVLLQYCKLDTLAMVMVWVHWTGSAARAGSSRRNTASCRGAPDPEPRP